MSGLHLRKPAKANEKTLGGIEPNNGHHQSHLNESRHQLMESVGLLRTKAHNSGVDCNTHIFRHSEIQERISVYLLGKTPSQVITKTEPGVLNIVPLRYMNVIWFSIWFKLSTFNITWSWAIFRCVQLHSKLEPFEEEAEAEVHRAFAKLRLLRNFFGYCDLGHVERSRRLNRLTPLFRFLAQAKKSSIFWGTWIGARLVWVG